MRRALVLPLFAALAFMATLMCPALSRGDGGLFGSNTDDRQRWLVSPTVHLSSTANTPLPLSAYLDPCIVTCPLGDSIFTVVVHLSNGQPVVNGDVVLDFSPCPSFHLLEPNLPTQYQVGASWALKLTDIDGRADFPLFAGGVCASTVKVYCAGMLLASRPVASFDQNGDLGVTDLDLAIINGKIGTADRTADFDCDGSVTSADYDIAAQHLGHIHHTSPLVGVGDGLAIAFGVRPLPNPTRGATDFVVRVPEGGAARLAIYDVSGRRLATVLDREIEAGVRHVSWSGRDDGGRAVASGVYHYRLTVGARQAHGTLIVAR